MGIGFKSTALPETTQEISVDKNKEEVLDIKGNTKSWELGEDEEEIKKQMAQIVRTPQTLVEETNIKNKEVYDE